MTEARNQVFPYPNHCDNLNGCDLIQNFKTFTALLVKEKVMIPSIIHQTWKDREIPQELHPFQASWKRYHPTWEYRLWTDVDCRKLIADHYSWFLPIYDLYPQPIMRTDTARCFILHHFGGIYADLDYECLKPFETLLAGKDLVLGCEPHSHVQRSQAQTRGFDFILSNAVMASVPGHRFWEHLFKSFVGAHMEPNPLDTTGPFLLTRAYLEAPDKSEINIISPEDLFPFDESEVWEAGTKRTTLPPPPGEAYGIHYWQGTWWRKTKMRWYASRPPKTIDIAQTKNGAGEIIAIRTLKSSLIQRILPRNAPSSRSPPRISSPIIPGILPEAVNGVWYQVTHQNEVVASALLDVKQILRFLNTLDHPPLVTALMVTKGRTALAQRAVLNFQKQTYPHCELVIVNDDEDDQLRTWVQSLADTRIHLLNLPTDQRSLGVLRNIAMQEARGDYVAQWDDDDFSHPMRLALETGLVLLHNADACFLQRWMLWAPEQRRLAISHRRLWEGSFLARKVTIPPYPDIAKGEDTPVADAIALNQRTVLLDYPQLYTYVIHSQNTHETSHFEKFFAKATAIYESGAYDIAIRQLQNDFDIDLSQWIEGQPACRYDHPISGRRSRRSPALASYPSILILTPVKNSAADIPRYIHNLHTLQYPHDKLTIGLLEGDSTDDTYEILSAALPQLAVDFHAAYLFKEDMNYKSALPRWVPSEQRRRRAAIAKSRNSLLMRSLDNQDWVLWIDVDVESFPADVLEHMLATGKDIIVPHCVLPDGRTFDLNTFKLEPGATSWDWSPYLIDGILQPPIGWGRNYLSDFPDEDLVELDSVGGTMLLVRAEVHRHGALFPVAPYNNLLETEGFASMARDMGYSCWGLPWLTIQHPRK